MSTRSSARNLFPPLDNPELTIRKRSRIDHTLLNDFEIATEGNGDPPVPDLRTMEELCQLTLNGRGGPISPIFDHFPRNSINTFEQMAKMFLGKYFPPSMVTKLRNKITNFRQHPDESLFEAWERYMLLIDRCPNHNMLPITQIDTFYNGLTLRHRNTINAAACRTFMKRRPEECYDLIETMIAHHNDWDTSAQQSESSSSITSSSNLEIIALKAKMAEINKNLMKVIQINQQVKAVTPSYETCGGPHSYNDCPAIVGQTQNVYAAGADHGVSTGGLILIPTGRVLSPADFHYMDDARDIWNAVKARFGGNAESKKMRKSMLKQEFLEFIIGEAEELHKEYDRMHKILRPSHSAFVSATSASKKMSYEDSLNYSSTTTYSVPSNSKTGSHRSDHDSESDGVIAAKEFGLIAGCDSKNAIEESAAKIYNLITGADQRKPLLQVMLENLLLWVSLLRFAKADSMKPVPPPLSGDYTSLSDHSDLDESQMSYVFLHQTTLLVLVLTIFQPTDDQHQSLLEYHPILQSKQYWLLVLF
nr:reverse transcriptase domain-containing protein [Tanacetum cinerariifolium]